MGKDLEYPGPNLPKTFKQNERNLLNFIRVISETSRSDVLAEIGGFTQGTNIESFKGCWEDDFPLPKGGRC